MKQMNYSPITALLRRIHRAKAKSDETGIPVKELMDQDRELRKQLQQERRVQEQRRDFMKTAGGIGLGAGLMSASSMALASNHNTQPEIAIVGAGVGGLRTAHRLMQYGMTSKVYEAGDRVGGRMYSDSTFFTGGRTIEYGGEFISTEHTAIRNLAHQLNLQLEDANKLSVGDEETYLIAGELYSEDQLMDVWVDGLYNVMKQGLKDAPWQPTYNSVHTPEHDRLDGLDAITWMGAGAGNLGLDTWVQKLLLADLVAEYGITEGNSALNLLYLLAYNPRSSGGLPLAGTDERFHVVGGNDQIPQAMANQLPAESIIFERQLVEITGPYGGPFTLEFASGDTATCDVLVLSLPHNKIKDIDFNNKTNSIWQGFSFEKRTGFLSPDNVSDNGKVIMEFTDRYWDRFTTIDGEQVHQAARAYSFANLTGLDGFISTWEGDPGSPSPLGILVNYNGGFEARNLTSTNLHGPTAPDDVDVNRFLAQAQKIWGDDGPMGTDIKDRWTGKALVSNWIDDPLAGSAFTSPTVGTMTGWWGAQWESDIPGNVFFAGEAYDEEYWSYMNGAVLSAERVAKEIHLNY